jgi:hypothetical protein
VTGGDTRQEGVWVCGGGGGGQGSSQCLAGEELIAATVFMVFCAHPLSYNPNPS